jgi:hypothetical protein
VGKSRLLAHSTSFQKYLKDTERPYIATFGEFPFHALR